MRTKGMGRRDFLKSSVAGLGGFIYLGSQENQPFKLVEDKREDEKRDTEACMGSFGFTGNAYEFTRFCVLSGY